MIERVTVMRLNDRTIQQMHHYVRMCDRTVLISELNALLALNVVVEGGLWVLFWKKLTRSVPTDKNLAYSYRHRSRCCGIESFP